jgi:endonuclease G
MKKLLLIITFLSLGSCYAQKNCITLKHSGYTSVFDTIHHVPFYTEYTLTKSEAQNKGKYKRLPTFIQDPKVGAEYQASNKEYAMSGYDKGHMVNAEDESYCKECEKESFLFTNVVPQNHKLNIGQWKELENHVRREALDSDSLLIITGCFGFETKIITTYIPENLFKIIYNYTTKTTEIYIIPNKEIGDYTKYLVKNGSVPGINLKDLIKYK